jgi:hypothetical protein
MSHAIRCLRNRGLAAALAGAAGLAAGQQPVVLQGLECRGDDPSWRLDANRGSAVFSTPGPQGKRDVVFRGSLQALSSLAPPVVVWRGDSTHLPRETLVVTLREEACPAPAGGAAPLTHRAVLSLKAGEALTGCCTAKMGSTPLPAPNAAPKRAP